MPCDLTIITISRDDPIGLRRTLASIANQDCPPRQVVVVRCGTSSTADIHDFHLPGLIECPDPGRGISAAFNAGVAGATSEWLMFLNGGDTLLNASSLDHLFSTPAFLSGDFDMLSGFACAGQATVPFRAPLAAADYLYLSHQASIIRRALFTSVGNYDTRFRIRMDLDWLARYLAIHGPARIAFLNTNIAGYELDGISSTCIFRFYIEELRVLIRYPRHATKLLRLLLRDIPARIVSPKAWPRRIAACLRWIRGGRSTSRSTAAGQKPQLLFDSSFTRLQQGHVGITRVVRGLVTELERNSPADWRVAPVAYSPSGFKLVDSAGPAPHMEKSTDAGFLRRMLRASSNIEIRRLVRSLLPVFMQRLAWRIFSAVTYGRVARQYPAVDIAEGDVVVLCDASWNYAIWPCALAAKARGARIVTMVHDLIPLNHPEFCAPLLTAIFRNWLRQALENSDAIICNSQATQRELEAFCTARGWTCPPTGHFRLGVTIAPSRSLEDAPRDWINRLPGGSAKPFFLVVGSVEPRKNHRVVLDAFDELWRSGIDAQLVVVGRPADGADHTVARMQHHAQLDHSLIWLTDCNDAELDLLYRHATALIFPSLAEGFGLPLVEARQRGCLVLASRIPAFAELADDGVLLFRPDSPAELQTMLTHILGSPPTALPPMPEFAWNESAREFVEGIRRLLKWKGNLL